MCTQINTNEESLCHDNPLHRGSTRKGILPGGKVRESSARGCLILNLKASEAERGFP